MNSPPDRQHRPSFPVVFQGMQIIELAEIVSDMHFQNLPQDFSFFRFA